MSLRNNLSGRVCHLGEGRRDKVWGRREEGKVRRKISARVSHGQNLFKRLCPSIIQSIETSEIGYNEETVA